MALVACLVAATLLWRDRSDLEGDVSAAEEQVQDGAAAEAAAREFVTQLTSFSHTTIDEACDQMEEAVTSDYLQGSVNVCTAPAIKLVKTSQATADGAILNAAAKPISGGRFEVLLFADQQITGPAKADCFLEETRLVVTMVEEGGRWLVDNLEIMNYIGSQNRLPCEKNEEQGR